jgi:hypothetical protein
MRFLQRLLVCGAAIALVSGAAPPALADGLDINLSEDAAYITYLTRAEGFAYDGADIGIGAMFTDEDDWLLSGKLLVMGSPGVQGTAFQLGAGAKAYAIDLDRADDQVFGIGIGGAVRYQLPTEVPLSLLVEGYYAPDITAFSGAEDIVDLSARVELEIAAGTRAYVGLRVLEVEGEAGGEAELDDGLHVGVRLTF